MDKNYDVKILGEETIYHGKRVTLKKLYIKVNGKETFKEIVDFGEAVAILPILNEHPIMEQTEIIVIKQYRPAVGKWIIEIPAGVVERGEKIEETAIRELIEETGYKPSRLEKLASIHPTPGYRTVNPLEGELILAPLSVTEIHLSIILIIPSMDAEEIPSAH